MAIVKRPPIPLPIAFIAAAATSDADEVGALAVVCACTKEDVKKKTLAEKRNTASIKTTRLCFLFLRENVFFELDDILDNVKKVTSVMAAFIIDSDEAPSAEQILF